MARFTVTAQAPVSTELAWSRLTRWPDHARFVPLTRIRVLTPPPSAIGTTFVARTGLGRVAFEDPMEITEWDPPTGGSAGRCHLEKRGRIMLGWAELRVDPIADGCQATWTEDIRLAHAPPWLDRPTVLSSRLLFGRVLRGLLGS
jgi:hypothetical protein